MWGVKLARHSSVPCLGCPAPSPLLPPCSPQPWYDGQAHEGHLRPQQVQLQVVEELSQLILNNARRA